MAARAKRSPCERRVLASASRGYFRCTQPSSIISISSKEVASEERSSTTCADCAAKRHAFASATRADTRATTLRRRQPARNSFFYAKAQAAKEKPQKDFSLRLCVIRETISSTHLRDRRRLYSHAPPVVKLA